MTKYCIPATELSNSHRLDAVVQVQQSASMRTDVGSSYMLREYFWDAIFTQIGDCSSLLYQYSYYAAPSDSKPKISTTAWRLLHIFNAKKTQLKSRSSLIIRLLKHALSWNLASVTQIIVSQKTRPRFWHNFTKTNISNTWYTWYR